MLCLQGPLCLQGAVPERPRVPAGPSSRNPWHARDLWKVQSWPQLDSGLPPCPRRHGEQGIKAPTARFLFLTSSQSQSLPWRYNYRASKQNSLLPVGSSLRGPCNHGRLVAVPSACVKVTYRGGRDSAVGPALTAALVSPATVTWLEVYRPYNYMTRQGKGSRKVAEP